MALKYQLFIEGTSLYAQVELDQKISSEMEQIIVGEDVQMIFKLINNVDDYVFGEGDIFGSGGNDDLLRCEQFTKEFGRDSLDEISLAQYEKNESYGNNNNNLNNSNNDKLKDEFMAMINTQDFIEGYLEENDKTKKIIEQYAKEFKLIKELKYKNIDEKTAITILIIYYIYKEHYNSLNDLILIIKKAKMFIEKVTNDSYDNIIKEAQIK